MTKEVKKRVYKSAVRQEQAARTRLRIIEAADELFRGTSYARTSIKQIAEAAGVAPDTIYAVFGSKPRILTAIIDERLRGGTQVSNVFERPESLAIQAEQDPRRQIEMFAEDIATVVERVGPIFEVMRSAASIDTELADVYREMEGYRLKNMSVFVGWLSARTKLSLSKEKATEIVWVTVSPDVARLLRGIRGWSRKQHAAWIAATLKQSLLGG